jgi:5-methylcytosine-specific restriction protein A
MPKKVPTFRPRGASLIPLHQAPRDNTAHRRFINSPAWRQCSKSYLRRNPACADCEAEGELTPATETHHTRGQDPEYYFEESTFLALCHRHHSKRTLEEQRRQTREGKPPAQDPPPCTYG